MPYPTFSEHLRSRYGKNWCVFARRTQRIIDRYGDDVTVLTPARYNQEQADWRASHPATLLVDSLPDSDEKRLIAKALERELY